MSAIPSFLKQIPTDSRNFIPVSSLMYPGGINALNATSGVLTQAAWAQNPAVYVGGISQGTRYASTINSAGGCKLRDMGRTYVSTGRVFRKVQLIVQNTQVTSTFGVEGRVNTTPVEDYLTGYIELGWEGSGGQPAPVARTA